MSGDNLPRWVPRFYRAFWSGPPVSGVQVSRFRMLFFALIAIDAFLLIAHAPRYGAGDFNVSHLGFLDSVLPMPTRVAVVVAALVMCFLGALIALGRAPRIAVPLLCVIYGGVYLSSQVDSFQHHYLLALLLLTACFIDWDRDDEDAGSWALRLLFLQVSVVYLFAAISKMEAGWWDGRALADMVTRGEHGWAADAIAIIGVGPAAKLVVLAELFLVFAIHIRLLRVPAVLVGVGLHAGIELADFKIGLFSYYMIGFYLLVLPPAAFRWAGVTPERIAAVGRAIGRGPVALWMAVAVVIAVVAVGTRPLDGAWIAAIVVAAIGAVGLAMSSSRRWTSGAMMVAAAAVVACSLSTDAVRDHYRFWGGSSRRLGDIPTATRAYQRLVGIEPDFAGGRRNLADLYRRDKRYDDALREYHEAVRLEPDAVAGHLGLARVFGHLSRGAEAIASATRARELAESEGNASDPRMRRAADEARRIESFWRKRL